MELKIQKELLFLINNFETVEKFFRYLNKDVDYVWLHGDKNTSWGDIDIAVSLKDFDTIENTIKRFCEKTGFKIIQIFNHEYCAKYFILCRMNVQKIEYLIPDICSHFVRDNRILINSDDLLKGKQFINGYYKCEPSIESEYVFLKRVLKNGWCLNHVDSFRNNFFTQKDGVLSHLKKYLKQPELSNFINCMEGGRLGKINAISTELRKKILIRTFLDNPLGYIYFKIRDFSRVVKRIIKPTGLVLAIIGTDGSGKSKISNELFTHLAPAFRRVKYYHWKPQIFNSKKQEMKIEKEPHGKPSRNILLSIGKLFYYVIQYIVGNMAVVFPQKLRSTMIIFDRYFYDIQVDQKRFRMNCPRVLIKLFLPFIPSPDLVFFLQTNPEISLKRKNELSIDELSRQNGEFLLLKDFLKDKFHVIQNNDDPDDAVNEIVNIILNYLEKRIVT